MCDCYTAECEDCSKLLPVHIGDFCTPRKNVLVRCWEHPPTEDDKYFPEPPKKPKWVKFTNAQDEYENPEGWEGDWYMAVVDYDDVSDGYDVGEAGDIVPNCDWGQLPPDKSG